MNKVLGHLKTINRHRWEVFKLCYKFGIPFQGLMHDLSKYSPVEFNEAIKYFKDGKCSPNLFAIKDKGISDAWEHHKRNNKHHFEYWYINRKGNDIPNMPFKYALEMFCDRVSASIVYQGRDYTNSSALKYLYKEKDFYCMNNNMKKYLELAFTKLSKYGMKKLKREDLIKIYNKCTNQKES